jgi:hypothetical protein
MIDILKLYRPDIWVRNLGVPLIGMLNLGFFPNPFYAITILFQLAFLQAYSFAINDYFDAKIRKEENYIAHMLKIYPSFKVMFLCILPLIFLIFTLFVFHGNLILLVLYIFLYDILYELPPFRLKKNFFFSILVSPISLVLLPFLYAYLSFANAFSMKAISFLIILFFYMAFHEIIHQMAHSRKEKVLPKKIGIKGGIKIAQLSLLIPILSSIISIGLNPLVNYIFVITIVFSVFRIYKLLKIELKSNAFEKIKNSWHKFYSVHEGILYVVFLVFGS